MKHLCLTASLFLLIAIVMLAQLSEHRAHAATATTLSQGGGSSLAFPLFSRLFFGWSVLRPQAEFSYTPSNSLNGILAAIWGNSTDWSDSDVLPNAEQLQAADENNRSLLVFPMLGAAVIPVVNLGSKLSQPPLLSQQALVKIFGGQISKWNDPDIVADNPLLADLDEEILVVVRSDSSGTTFGFTTALSSFDSSVWIWPPSFQFPSEAVQRYGNRSVMESYTSNGNLNMLSSVVIHPYSIGYLAYSYASLSGFPAVGIVSMKDPLTGEAITPIMGLQMAGANAIIEADGQLNLTALPVQGAWPISVASYVLFNIDFRDYDHAACQRASETALFFSWALRDAAARQDGLQIGYIPPPFTIARNLSRTLNGLSCKGQPLIPITYVDQRDNGVWVAMLVIAMVCCLIPIALALGFGISDASKATRVGIVFIGSTLLGALLLLTAVVVFYLVPTNDAICQLRSWMVGVGYVLLITPVCSKVFWLTVTAVRSNSMKRTRLSFIQMIIPIVVSLALQVALLVIWTTTDPYQSTTKILDTYSRTAIYTCDCSNIWLWIGLEIGYFSVLVLLGFLLSFYATETPLASVREVAWIGFTLYNLLVFMVILIPLIGAFENSEEAVYFEITIGLIFSSVFTLLTLYSHYLATGVATSAPFIERFSTRSSSSHVAESNHDS